MEYAQLRAALVNNNTALVKACVELFEEHDPLFALLACETLLRLAQKRNAEALTGGPKRGHTAP